MAVNALWMVGHVQTVLACEIRLQSLSTEDCFMAPHHEVHPDVFRVFNDLTMGSLHSQGPLVTFRTDERPGAREAENLQRARSVQLANLDRIDSIDSIGLPIPQVPDLFGLWGHCLQCPIAKSAALEWCVLLESRNKAEMLACQAQLRGVFSQATAEEDGSRLCSILLCCIAGLLVLSEVSETRLQPQSSQCTQGRDRYDQYLDVGDFSSCSAELLRIANDCWGMLDLQHKGTRQSLLATKPLCQEVIKGTGEGGEGGEEWQKFADYVESCFSQKLGRPPGSSKYPQPGVRRRERRRCEVAGCKSVAARMVLRDDAHGPAGFRCDRHGGRLACTLPGCKRPSNGIVRVDDEFGPAGHRCIAHGARRCTVSGCHRPAKCNAPADNLAPAGRRCAQHSPLWPKASQSGKRWKEPGLSD